MKKNIGSIDTIIRLVISALIVVLYFTHVIEGITGIVLLIVAVILTLTTVVSTCPIYLATGLSSRRKK